MNRCKGTSSSGSPCRNPSSSEAGLCHIHSRSSEQRERLHLQTEILQLRRTRDSLSRSMQEHIRNCQIAKDRSSSGPAAPLLVLEPESGDPLRLLVNRHRLRWTGERWIEVEDETTWTDREALVLGTLRRVGAGGREL